MIYIPADSNVDRFHLQAMMLAEVVRRILQKKGDIVLSSKPTIEKRNITEFRKRMRVTSITKFDEKTYISTVNFFDDEKAMEKNKALGAIVLYIPESYVVKLLKELGYPVFDEEDGGLLEDACGTFCNLLAGNFNTGLTQLGYKELTMSHFSTYQNDVVAGVPFSPDQKDLYEINFEIGGVKRLVVDLTLGSIPEAPLF